MAKFLIEYELKANISDFNKEASRAGKKTGELNKAIDKSVLSLNALGKDRGLEQYFERANEAAKKLKKQILELDRLEKLKKPRANTVELARQSVGAGRLEYAAEIAAANKAIAQSLAPVPEPKTPEANIVRARYALYDLANEARRVGTIMTGLSLAVVKVGADFQRSFVDVQRTTGLVGSDLDGLRKSLIEISTGTSVSFTNVARLATLAAQMGIEGENIAEFSETVAKFSAVTGVTVENTAQSFGRIAQLLGVTSDEYDNLASSILYAGRNSVATEAEILSVTTQIAASAEAAGFLASEAVGLGTALASLRIQPEQARGVILRLFADFDKAMAKNGKDLADYAAILGMTTEATRNLYEAGGPDFFVALTKALGDAQAAGTDMNVVLGQIGITNTREINVLERLVGNHELLVDSLNDATSAYKENTDLAAQFEQVMGTVTEQLARFQNNIAAIADSAGNFLPVMATLTLALTLVNNVLEFISQNNALAAIVALTAAVGIGVGAFLLYKSALLQATASALAYKTAIGDLGGATALSTLSIRNLIGRMLELTPATGKANVSIAQITAAMKAGGTGARAFGLFIKAIPFLAAAGFAFQAVKSFIEFKDATERAKYGVSELKSEILSLESVEEFSLFTDSSALSILVDGSGVRLLSDFQNALYDFQSTAANPQAANAISYLSGGIRNLTEQQAQILRVKAALQQLIDEGEYQKASELMAEIKNQSEGIGMSTTELNAIFPNYAENLNIVADGLDRIAETDAADELRDVAAAIKEDLTAAFITPQKNMANFTVSTLDFLQALKDSKNGINVFAEDGRKAFTAFEGMINAIADKAGTDLPQALMASAAAIQVVEQAGGDASSQLTGLVEKLNEEYDIKLDPTAFSTLDQLRQAILTTAGVSAAARAEISKLLSGGEFSDVFSSIFAQLQQSMSDTSRAARREVRTVFDYVSELNSIFDNITQLAFASQIATDNSREGWESITRSVKSARKAVIDIKKELAESATDRRSLENQLDIAKRYGDINEIRRITAEIEALDARVAESGEELAYQEGRASLTLKGNTRAARENRAEIRARVDDSKDLITAYAQTAKANGKLPTAAEVKAYARKIARDFASQARAIGFSADELAQYTDVIRGFGTAAGNITPPNVDVNLNPVTTAIDAYLAKKKSTSVTVDPNLNVSVMAAQIAKLFRELSKTAEIETLNQQISTLQEQRVWRIGAGQSTAVIDLELKQARARRKALRGYATGGYVSGPGTQTSDSIPAMLSSGEYVIRAAAVERHGVGFFDSLNQIKSGSAQPSPVAAQRGGSVSSTVYLSEMDRALLRKAIDRPVSLYTTDRKIAESANAGNKELARRGSR